MMLGRICRAWEVVVATETAVYDVEFSDVVFHCGLLEMISYPSTFHRLIRTPFRRSQNPQFQGANNREPSSRFEKC